jgi:2-keto-4-pentenoate hydratase/2-oxohepta-3-ene-1,7-dioic acid hydratase in catechol pathway
MRFINFVDENGLPGLGVRIGEEVVDISSENISRNIFNILNEGRSGIEKINAVVGKSKKRMGLENIKWLPPIISPSKAIAVGLNYKDHAAEGKMDVPKYPVLFHRFPSSWVAHKEPLLRPRVSNQFDYEGELVVIIGKEGRYINQKNALEYVAGYSIFNDGSIRDYQTKSAQWMMGKNFDATGSFGPEFVTVDELPEGAKGLKLRTRLNGEVLQDANTEDMIFDVATLISICSEPFKLQPGDIIISGTPSGVGAARTPQIFMKKGDVCEVEIEGIGILSNPVEDEIFL